MATKVSVLTVLCWGLLLCGCFGDDMQNICGPSVTSRINTAKLQIEAKNVDNGIIVQYISEECHTCPLQNMAYMGAEQPNCTFIVDTRWPMKIAIISNDTQHVDKNCTDGKLNTYFNEDGIYRIFVVKKNNTITCSSYQMNSPVDSNITVYVTLGIFGFLALLWIGYKKIKSGRWVWRFLDKVAPSYGDHIDPEIYATQDLGAPTNASVEQGPGNKERLKSLDTFRGISLVVMMFVNYGGAKYWFFAHSKWNGLTVADLVFPWFVWIMGTAMAYSFASLGRRASSKCSIFLKILKRAIILFALGLLISSGGSGDPVDFESMRIMGVLQRFSLTYFITATVHMFLSRTDSDPFKPWSWLRDVLYYWPEWIIHVAIVTVYLLLTFQLSEPGCPNGYIGPGGLANDSDGRNVFDCVGGAAGYIDRSVFGHKHVYGHPTSAELYKSTQPYDPEGLLGTLTSCFLCFLGLQAGKIFVLFKTVQSRITRFMVWAIVLGLIATLLCKGQQNDGWIPINKNLWSLSYVLAMASMAFVLLTFCFLTIDVYKIWSGAPFYYPGMNSIVIYMCHEIFGQPFQTFWAIDPHSHATYMLINVCDVSVWVLLSFFLYCNKIFVSI